MTNEIKITLSTVDRTGSIFTKMTQDVDTMKGKLSGLVGALQSVSAVALAVGTGGFLIAAIRESENYQNSLRGLASIARYAGEDIGATMREATQISADGMMTMAESATALKNLLSRGFALDEAVRMIMAFKDSAAFGRQASLSFGEAVVSATEGIKNENSILVDNAGVTKNVSMMWKEFAAAHGTTADKLTLSQKRQAELTGVLRESEGVMGNAALAAGGLTGQYAALTKATKDLQAAIGETFTPGATRLVEWCTAAINKGIFPYIQSVKQATIYTAGFLEKIDRRGGQNLWDMVFNPSDTSDIDQRVKEMIAETPLWKAYEPQSPEIGKDSGKRLADTEKETAAAMAAAEAEKKAAQSAKDWAGELKSLASQTATAGLTGLAKELAEIDLKAAGLRTSFGPHVEIDTWAASMKGAAQSAFDFKEAMAMQDNVTALYTAEMERRTQETREYRDMMDNLSLETLPEYARSVENIRRKYADLERQITDLAGAGYISMERAQQMVDGLSANMALEYQGLAAKTEETAGEMSVFWEEGMRNMQDFSQDFFFEAMKGNFDDLGERFEDMVLRMVANWQAAQLQMAMWGTDAKAGGGLGNGLIAAGVNWATSLFSGGGIGSADYINALDSFYTVNAKGNIYDGPGIESYKNSIVNRPTLFGFARGIGLMGERGSEAIMPLTRTAGGDLGVRAVGGNVVVNVINNVAGVQATKRENTDALGNRIVEVMVEQIKGSIARDVVDGRGVIPAAFASTYGLNRAAGAY